MKQKLITIAICTKNRPDILRKSLTLLVKQLSKSNNRYELIVVDQSSDTKTKNLLDEFCIKNNVLIIKYIRQLSNGIGVSRNKAISISKSPILVFIDDDVHISKNWEIELNSALKKFPKAAILGGKILPISKIKMQPWLKSFSKEDMSAPFALVDKGNEIKVLTDDCLLPTANIVIRKKYFRKIGFFNNVFAGSYGLFKVFGGEDIDFVQRALNNKLQVVYWPKLTVYHNILPYKFDKRYLRGRFFQNGIELAIFKNIHGFTINGYEAETNLWNILRNIKRIILIYISSKQDNFIYEISLFFDLGYIIFSIWNITFYGRDLKKYKYSVL